MDEKIITKQRFDDFLPAVANFFLQGDFRQVWRKALTREIVESNVFLTGFGLYDKPVFCGIFNFSNLSNQALRSLDS